MKPIINSDNAKVEVQEGTGCLRVSWNGCTLNLSDNDNLILEYCKSCKHYQGFHIFFLECDKRGEEEKGKLLFDVFEKEDGMNNTIHLYCKDYERK